MGESHSSAESKAGDAGQVHHEFCGWGDSWERSCARKSKLPARISNFLDRVEGR